MKTKDRIFLAEMRNQGALKHELGEVLEIHRGRIVHVSAFAAAVRISPDSTAKQDLALCIANQTGLSPNDLQICLLLEEEEFIEINGSQVIKPSGWGLVGGGVDIADILDDGGSLEAVLTKDQKKERFCSLVKDIGVDDFLVMLERALHRESREEAGLQINPFWALYKVDVSEKENGSVNIVVTVLCEILSMSDSIDKNEVKEKRILRVKDVVPEIARTRPGMYKSHGRRLRKVLSFFGRNFDSVTSSLRAMFESR